MINIYNEGHICNAITIFTSTVKLCSNDLCPGIELFDGSFALDLAVKVIIPRSDCTWISTIGYHAFSNFESKLSMEISSYPTTLRFSVSQHISRYRFSEPKYQINIDTVYVPLCSQDILWPLVEYYYWCKLVGSEL